MKKGRAGENDGWKRARGNKRAKSGRVFSIKEACKEAGGEDRESETSPQHLIIRMGAIERYERGNQPRSVRRFEIGSEGEHFVGMGDPPGDTLAHNAGQVLTNP